MPVVSMASSCSGTVLTSAISPPPVDEAVKRLIWLPAFVSVVPPAEIVCSAAVTIGAICEIPPACAVSATEGAARLPTTLTAPALVIETTPPVWVIPASFKVGTALFRMTDPLPEFVA